MDLSPWLPVSLSEYKFAADAFVAGLLASIACGVGALPLAISGLHLERRIGLGYAFAAGLMFSASVYNLLLPAFTIGGDALELSPVLQTLGGMALGSIFLYAVERFLTPERLQAKFLNVFGGKTEALIFIAMAFHSVPEGVAVGVGYGAEPHLADGGRFAMYIAIAIAIHNIPEGLAVALPMRSKGASIWKCFFFAFLTSLPQPIAAVPSSLLVWLFEPLMIPLLGFAAGAMMYLVLLELLPEALERHSRTKIAWSFLAGFGLMVLVQVGL